MYMNYALVLMATVLLAVDFVLQNQYQRAEGADLVSGLTFNALNGLLTALVFWALSGFSMPFSPFSLLLALGMSLCLTAYSVLGFRILKTGNMSTYTLFLMSGGMLLPYLFGVLFLDEPLTVWRIVGVVLILAAVLLTNRARLERSVTFVLLCVAVFVLNGFVSILSKCHQIHTVYETVDSMAFVMYSGLGKFFFSAVALACRRGGRKPAFAAKSTPWLVLGSALIGGVSYTFQLIGAKALPATVLYPLVTGGCIVFSALAEKLYFKAKLSPFQWASIALCFLGTVFFL